VSDYSGTRQGHRAVPVLANRYRLLHEIAQGGMGTVWQAVDRQTSGTVAVKLQTGAWNQRSFEREVTALRSISHEHVVRILDAGRDHGRGFIVMELLDGVTLSARLRDGPRLGLDEAKLVVAQAALGLAAAHEAGVVHRDIKPSNLLLARTERGTRVKVLDFGIARPTVVEGDASVSALVGSPSYMSPEQARGLAIDERTDLWALAAVAFKMLTGNEPFGSGDLPSTLQRICEGRALPLRELRPELAQALTPFFKRAFRVDPAQRFRSARDLSEAFARACPGGTLPSLGRSEQTAPLEPAAREPCPTTRRKYWSLALTASAIASATWLASTAGLSLEPQRAAVDPAQTQAAWARPVGGAKEPIADVPQGAVLTAPAPPAPTSGTLAGSVTAIRPVRRNTRPGAPASVALPMLNGPRVSEAPEPSALRDSAPTTDPLDRRF
jgi:serine/threonine protein kinase